MTVSTMVAAIMISLTITAAPAPTPAPTDSASGDITITIPRVAGVNDGGSRGGGSQGGGVPTPVCTVINPPAAPVPPPTSKENAPELTIKPAQAAQGSQVEVRLDGYQAGERVQIVSYPGARVLGNLTARANGTLDSTILIPAKQASGPTTIEATGWLDCRVSNGSLVVESPPGSGSSFTPWGAWIIVLSGLGLGGICAVIAIQFGLLPGFRFVRRFA